MMKKINSKLIIELIIIVTLMLALTTAVFAVPVIVGGGSANTQNDTNTQNAVPNVINTNSNYNTSNTSYRTNTNNTLPKTGVTDGYVVAILVTVCARSAIYAYKKIRDYNIK